MKVYHASSLIVGHPETAHSRSFDFGPGFYVTTLESQAIDRCLTFIESRKL